jgi:hypothetical protein
MRYSLQPSFHFADFPALTWRRRGSRLGLCCAVLLSLFEVDEASAKGHNVERLMRTMELGPPAHKRLRIITKLGQSRDPRVLPMLRLALQDESGAVRRRARRALRALSLETGSTSAATAFPVQPTLATPPGTPAAVSTVSAPPGTPVLDQRPPARFNSKRVHLTVGFGADAPGNQSSYMAFVRDNLLHNLKTLPGSTVSTQSLMLTRDVRDLYARQYWIDGGVQVMSRSWDGGQNVACKVQIVVSSLPAQQIQLIATEEGTVKSGNQQLGEAVLERACLQAAVNAFRNNLRKFLETHRYPTNTATAEAPPRPAPVAPVAARPRDPDAAMEISFDEPS